MRFSQLVGRDQRNCGNREDLVMMVMDGADAEIRMVNIITKMSEVMRQ